MMWLAATEADREEATRKIRALLEERRIASVAYLVVRDPDGVMEWPLTRGHGWEGAEAGVRLSFFDGGTLDVRWSQLNWDEGLWIGVEGDGEGHWAPDVQPVAAGAWAGVTGASITSVRVGWHEPGLGRFFPWSLRVDVDSRSFVIALGELAEDGSGLPSYIPDCVVVIWDETVARSYGDRVALTSAWCEEIDEQR